MKSLKKYVIPLAIIISTTFPVVSQDIRHNPLDQYLQIAAENNPELKSIFNQYLAELELMPQVKALPDPTIVFNVFTSPVETRVGAQRAGVSLNQTFPWFGQLKASEYVAAQKAKVKYELFLNKKNEIFFEVRSAYYDLYLLNASIRITRENIRLLETFMELANVRLESSKGNAIDLLRVEMEMAELQNQLLFLEDSQIPIHATFRQLLNDESIINIQLPDTLPSPQMEGKNSLLDSIINKNPSLRKFDYELEALSGAITVAEAMGKPSFQLGVSYINVDKRNGVAISDNGKDALIFPQVGIRIPLNRKKYRAMIKEKELLSTSAVERKENRSNQLTTELEKTWRDYQDAERRIGLFLNLVDIASQVLDLLTVRYTTLGTDYEEMLRIEKQLLRYKLELERARADQNTSAAYIDYLTGKNL